MNDIPHPRDNEKLYGHLAAENLLLQAWNSGKMPHAWLISGPKGIGKATLAYRFARFVLSGGEGGSLEMPESHPVFQRVRASGHGDLLVLEKNEATGKDIKVDEARKIPHFLHLTASETDYRIVIIDSIDDMNTAASNAILKLLEEPPAHALMLLISHAPGKLLPTIRSRCRQLRLPALSQENVERVVHQAAPEFDVSDIRSIAPLSEGSAGLAIALLAGGGLDIYRKLMKLLSNFPRLESRAILAFANELGGKKSDSTVWELGMHGFVWLLAKTVHYKATGVLPASITGRETEVIHAIAHETPLEKLVEMWENSRRLIASTEHIHLDKRTTIVNLLEGLRRGEMAA